jgi:hypothetical protein
MEAHDLLSDPDMQKQLETYMKVGCQALPSIQNECVALVDQYAPMVRACRPSALTWDQVLC